jgi:hypothetical protein
MVLIFSDREPSERQQRGEKKKEKKRNAIANPSSIHDGFRASFLDCRLI